MSKQEDDFQILAKGYEDISHAILDNIENKDKENEKKANMDNLLGVFHWFLDNNVVVPKRLAKFIGDCINKGTITHTTKLPRGFNTNAGYKSAMICLDIFALVLSGLNKTQAIEQYAKTHNHETTDYIWKAIDRHGKTARDMIPMVWDTPLTPAQLESIDILLVHAKD